MFGNQWLLIDAHFEKRQPFVAPFGYCGNKKTKKVFNSDSYLFSRCQPWRRKIYFKLFLPFISKGLTSLILLTLEHPFEKPVQIGALVHLEETVHLTRRSSLLVASDNLINILISELTHHIEFHVNIYVNGKNMKHEICFCFNKKIFKMLNMAQ